MKPITNILLVAFLIVYLFLPFFDVAFDGGWTGFKYTAETISNADDWLKMLFSLVPFVAGFGGIAINCMKNRYWGLAAAAFIALGLYFYIDAKDFVNIQLPQFYNIKDLGYGFNVGYILLFAALLSAILSVLPFSFNKFLAREIHEIGDSIHIKKDRRPKSTPDEN